jgi:hypothetical protein
MTKNWRLDFALAGTLIRKVNPSTIRTIVFFCLITAACASETLNTLVNASAVFLAAILQQLATVQNDPTPTILAEKTISYAKAKTAYFTALRDAVPELEDIATGREARPPEVDMFAQTFSVAGEKQEKAADAATEVLLKRFEGNPDVQKAKVDFDCAQEVEERFHRDFAGLDFTFDGSEKAHKVGQGAKVQLLVDGKLKSA